MEFNCFPRLGKRRGGTYRREREVLRQTMAYDESQTHANILFSSAIELHCLARTVSSGADGVCIRRKVGTIS